MSDKGKASAKPVERPKQVDAPKRSVSPAAMQASARKTAAQAGGMARPTAQKQASPSDARRTVAGKRDVATPLSAKGDETPKQHERPKTSSLKSKENARRTATAMGGKETSRGHSRFSLAKDKKSPAVYYNRKLIEKGQKFHRDERSKLKLEREEYSEVQVEMGDNRKGRIDIYKPRVGQNGEVIENKYTRLGGISNATYNKYIKQLKGYLGRDIYSPKYSELKNQKVNKAARPILVIPRQSYRNVKERAIAEQRRKDARKRGVHIRESTSTSL